MDYELEYMTILYQQVQMNGLLAQVRYFAAVVDMRLLLGYSAPRFIAWLIGTKTARDANQQ